MSGLPSGWVRTTIGEVIEARVEQRGPSGSDSFVYIDISSVDRATKRVTSPQTLPITDTPSRARQNVKTNDVLVSMTRPNLNAVAIVPPEYNGAVASTGFEVLRTDCVNPQWLSYLVQTTDFVETMTALTQGALYPAVRPKDIRNYDIELPPEREQERIVDQLDALLTDLESSVAALKRVQANLKRYRASVLKAACEGRLVPTEAELARKEGRPYETGQQLLQRILVERRDKWEADQLAKMIAAGKPPKNDDWKKRYKEPAPPDTSNLPELPEGWTWASLEQLATRITDGTHQPPPFTESGIPFVFIQHMVSGRVTFQGTKFISRATYEQLNRRCPVQKGDILYSAVGWSYGLAVIVHTDEPFSFQRHIAHIKNPLINACYLQTCLNSPIGKGQADRMIRGVAQPTVALGDLCRFAIPLPPEAEQERIAPEVDRRLSVLADISDVLRIGLSRASRLRQSILKRAFEGKLVPQDPNDEPASVLLERIRAGCAAKRSNNTAVRRTRRRAMAEVAR